MVWGLKSDLILDEFVDEEWIDLECKMELEDVAKVEAKVEAVQKVEAKPKTVVEETAAQEKPKPKAEPSAASKVESIMSEVSMQTESKSKDINSQSMDTTTADMTTEKKSTADTLTEGKYVKLAPDVKTADSTITPGPTELQSTPTEVAATAQYSSPDTSTEKQPLTHDENTPENSQKPKGIFARFQTFLRGAESQSPSIATTQQTTTEPPRKPKVRTRSTRATSRLLTTPIPPNSSIFSASNLLPPRFVYNFPPSPILLQANDVFDRMSRAPKHITQSPAALIAHYSEQVLTFRPRGMSKRDMKSLWDGWRHMELRNLSKEMNEVHARRAAKMAFNKAFEVLSVREVEKAEREEREKIARDAKRMKTMEMRGGLETTRRKEIPLRDEEEKILNGASSIPSSTKVGMATALTTHVTPSKEPREADAPVETDFPENGTYTSRGLKVHANQTAESYSETTTSLPSTLRAKSETTTEESTSAESITSVSSDLKSESTTTEEPTSPGSTATELDSQTATSSQSPSSPPDTQSEDPTDMSISTESPTTEEPVLTEDTGENEPSPSPPDPKPESTTDKSTSPGSTTAAAPTVAGNKPETQGQCTEQIENAQPPLPPPSPNPLEDRT
jgi:trimeric autotransporter adhesin